MTDFIKLRQLAIDRPEEFKRIMALAKETTVIPHPGQRLVLDSPARFKVMNCGRRWGKTMIAAKMAVQATRKANQMVWWVAPQYKITKRGYDEVLKQLPAGVLSKPAPPSSNFDAGRSVILHFKNGSKMEFYSAERPEGMLGAAVDFAVLDEAAIMPSRIWNQIISPTLIDHLGTALMISTPRGYNWFRKVWLKGQDELQTDWASWTFSTQDNPTLPEGEADRMAEDMPKMEADQEIFAKWTAAGSSVFILDEGAVQDGDVLTTGLVEGSPPLGHIVLGIDLARTNDYTVIYGNRARDRKNVYFERMQAVAWAEQRRRIHRACRTLSRHGAESLTLMVDEGNAGSVIVEDLQEAGYDVIGVNFTTHKANMVRLLANDLERGRACILDEGVEEFTSYQLSMTPTGRITYSAPEGDHDDIVSAKMLAHWGVATEGIPEVMVLEAATSDEVIEERDPWDEEDENIGDWDDLVDQDSEAMESIGLVERTPTSRPSEQELLLRPELWF